MDLNQATQLLTWLDEEHRKDKALLMKLQSQADARQVQLTEQARQLQEIQGALTRIESQFSKLAQLEDSVQSIRTEFTGLLQKHAAEQQVREEQRTRAEKLESETIVRLVRELQERVDALGALDSTVAVLRDEDSRLQGELTKALAQLSEASKRLEAQDQHVTSLSQDAQVLREGLASARLVYEDLSNKSMALKAALDGFGLRLDTKLEQLQSTLEEVSKRQQTDLGSFQVKQQEQGRLVEGLDKEVKAAQTQMARWTKQMEEFTAQFERNRKTLYDLHELERQMRHQGNELVELQRLAAERQRTELREWQDDQARVDEEQTARLEQLETWQQKATETLAGLRERLEQNRQDLEALANELWQTWAEYMQGHVKLIENIVEQRETR